MISLGKNIAVMFTLDPQHVVYQPKPTVVSEVNGLDVCVSVEGVKQDKGGTGQREQRRDAHPHYQQTQQADDSLQHVNTSSYSYR